MMLERAPFPCSRNSCGRGTYALESIHRSQCADKIG
jgi:hypothetical protein